jgi:NADPH:quinone reductase-like Zn-dependent oxidoreductase
VCGVVSALGYGTSGFEVGDEVFGVTDWYRNGAAADYVAVEARNLAPRPKGCSSLEAAALPLSGLTAWQALFEHGRLRPHQSVLITGATGGVGVFAVQLARAGGARVHAAGHAAHAAVATELGAEVFVDLDHEDWVKEAGQVDLVFDLVGGEVLDRVVQAKSERALFRWSRRMRVSTSLWSNRIGTRCPNSRDALTQGLFDPS